MNYDEIIKELLRWFESSARDLPWRRTRDPYAIWVSEIMLQQTQVATVIPFWIRWMGKFPTVQHLARANESEVLKLWEGLGYYRRARSLLQAARQHGDSKWPRDLAGWLALPGIGPYTAGAICSIAFNSPSPVVDGNVVRVLSRLLGICEKAEGAQKPFWEAAKKLIHICDKNHKNEDFSCGRWNQSLMELGATICFPRDPKCHQCPVQMKCHAFQNRKIEQLPVLPTRPKAVQIRRISLLVCQDGKFALQQAAEKEWNERLWQFPTFEVPWKCDRKELDQLTVPFKISAQRKSPVMTLTHTITKHRIKLDVFEAHLACNSASANSPQIFWASKADLNERAMSSAQRKIANFISTKVTQRFARRRSQKSCPSALGYPTAFPGC